MKPITTKPDWKTADRTQKMCEKIHKYLEDGLDAQAEIRKATGLDLPDDDFVSEDLPSPFCYYPAKCRETGRCERQAKGGYSCND